MQVATAGPIVSVPEKKVLPVHRSYLNCEVPSPPLFLTSLCTGFLLLVGLPSGSDVTLGGVATALAFQVLRKP